jgi:Zn-dependent peptidase ImmA (M78 family)
MSYTTLLLQRFEVSTLIDASERLVNLFAGSVRRGLDGELQRLIQKLGVQIETNRDAKFEGKYSWSPQGDLISISNTQHGNRLRFTLAHELGHCLLRRFAKQDEVFGERFRGGTVDSSDRQEEERAANAVAAELLMPRRAVVELIHYERLSWQVVSKLRKSFCISEQSAIRRLAEISNSTFAFVSLIPRSFQDLGTCVTVDEFLFIRPDRPIEFGRDGICLNQRVKFNELMAKREVSAGIRTETALLSGKFCVRRSMQPIPTAKLLGCVDVKPYARPLRNA